MKRLIKNVCIDSVLSVKDLQCSCQKEIVTEYDKLFADGNASTQGVRRLVLDETQRLSQSLPNQA